MASPQPPLRDLDTQQAFDEVSQRIEAPDCHNLAVKFGPSLAWAGLNLSLDDVNHLMHNRKQNIEDFQLLLHAAERPRVHSSPDIPVHVPGGGACHSRISDRIRSSER